MNMSLQVEWITVKTPARRLKEVILENVYNLTINCERLFDCNSVTQYLNEAICDDVCLGAWITGYSNSFENVTEK